MTAAGLRMNQSTSSRRPKVAVLYHYLHPDDVISARHFDGFCEDLAARGWDVEALPCNRGCRDESRVYARSEDWHGVRIRRVWRPAFRQSSTKGRLLNAAWMIASWAGLALRRPERRPDVVVVGTDPVLSVVVAWVLRCFARRIKIAHWCYDLYPEAPIADGMISESSLAARLMRRILPAAYRSCDLIADLGGCMRERLGAYGGAARRVTLTPWALAEPARPEPADPAARQSLFGDAPLGLLYSGNFGRAHSYGEFLELARRLRGSGVRICFGVRGNREAELRSAVRPDDENVGFAPFAPEAELERRLGAADIHLASLRPGWTGVVVPSKFFGSLAAGRPVIFAGSRESAVARWIVEHGVGWVLDAESMGSVAAEMRRLAAAPAELQSLQQHCHDVYRTHFSRGRVLDLWDEELRRLLGPGRAG